LGQGFRQLLLKLINLIYIKIFFLCQIRHGSTKLPGLLQTVHNPILLGSLGVFEGTFGFWGELIIA
jgi:hypothetical protein